MLIKFNNILQEHRHVCECGGYLEMLTQAVEIHDDGTFVEIHDNRCNKCGMYKEFVSDITSQSESIEIREYSVTELGLAKDLKATEPLVNALKSEKYISVKAKIVWALKILEDPEAIPALINELQSQDEYENYLKYLDLQEEQYDFEKALQDQDDYEEYLYKEYKEHCSDDEDKDDYADDSNDYEPDYEEIETDIDDFEYKQHRYEMAGPDDAESHDGKDMEAEHCEDTVESKEDEPIDEDYYNESGEPLDNQLYMEFTGFIETPVSALISFGQQAFDHLLNVLNDDNAMVRASAVKVIGHSDDCRARPVLLEKLKDDNELVQSNALEALAEGPALHDIDSISKYIVWKSQDESPLVRAKAIEIMGNFPSVFMDSLIAFLKDNDEHIRAIATIGLGKSKDCRAVEPLIQVLLDKDDILSNRAKSALIEIGTEAIEPLIGALKDALHWKAVLEQTGWFDKPID